MAEDRNENGQFAKGRKKTGGKQKGYEAPAKKELRQMMHDFSVDAYENFMEAYLKCEPYQKCRVYLEAVKFNLPMLQSVTLEDKQGATNDLTERLKSMSEMSSDK
nr:MAG TPA: hypothetical protein [Bacteriophage sp.]